MPAATGTVASWPQRRCRIPPPAPAAPWPMAAHRLLSSSPWVVALSVSCCCRRRLQSAGRASRNPPEFADRRQWVVRGTDRASGVRTFDSPPERRLDSRACGISDSTSGAPPSASPSPMTSCVPRPRSRRFGARREADDLTALKRVADDYEVGRAVLGLPLNMDGTEGPSARLARAFAPKVESALGVPVELFDERLSTFEAETRLRERGFSARDQRAVIDAEAAAVILQGWLEARASDEAPPDPARRRARALVAAGAAGFVAYRQLAAFRDDAVRERRGEGDRDPVGCGPTPGGAPAGARWRARRRAARLALPALVEAGPRPCAPASTPSRVRSAPTRCWRRSTGAR